MIKAIAALALSLPLLAACSHDPELVSDSKLMLKGVGVPVMASAETVSVGTLGQDAADDPYIFISTSTGEGLIAGTDKKAGLYIYDLTGKVVSFAPTGPINNVDGRRLKHKIDNDYVAKLYGLDPRIFPPSDGNSFSYSDFIAATDRVRNGVVFYNFLDNKIQESGFQSLKKIQQSGFSSVEISEAYGFCVGKGADSGIYVVTVGKNGNISVSISRGSPELKHYADIQLGSQAEGCVIDDKTGKLYIAEEAKGIWAYELNSLQIDLIFYGGFLSKQKYKLIAGAPSAALAPDVEGLTIMRDGKKSYLIASSQGNSTFAVFEISDNHAYRGSFSVIAGNGIDAVTGTDGLDAFSGPIGPYPQGIVVVQDDVDTDGEAPTTVRQKQNFKIIDWRAIKAALKL